MASIVLVRALLPWGLARVAESQGSKQMGRLVQLGDLDLDLLMGRIVVGPLLERLEDPEARVDPDRVLLSLARLGVELSWGKLLTGELRLVEVSLESPRAQIIRSEDGGLVPIRVAPPAPEEEAVVHEEPSEPGLALVLRGLSGPQDDRYLATEMLAEAAASDSELPAVSAAEARFFERRRLMGALEQHARGDERALAELDAEDAQLLDRWVAEVEVPDSRREELARTRAKRLSDRLANQRGVDAERVRMGDPMTGEPAVVIELAPAG